MAKKKKKKNSLLTWLVRSAAVTLVLCAAALLILNSQVMAIQHISVVGNRNIMDEEIISMSGISLGDQYGAVSDAQIRERLEQNRYLVFERTEFDYNSRRLTLHVSERIGWGVIYAYGLYYVVDETGVVLECTGKYYPENVAGPKINGLIETERSSVYPSVGSRLAIQTTVRLEVMEEVLRALDETNMLMRMASIDVTFPDDITLMTDGMTMIELGDTQNLHAKLLLVHEVLYLRESEGDVTGVRIDVSSGNRAHYIPAILPTPTPMATATPEPEETPTP